jgi:outer membrane receptor protein involved in Fe transport
LLAANPWFPHILLFNTSTATKTDTPLFDIPQSIQVIPRQIIDDRGVTRVGEIVQNVSGVTVTA